jgi:serine/threonine-protein kinase PknK
MVKGQARESTSLTLGSRGRPAQFLAPEQVGRLVPGQKLGEGQSAQVFAALGSDGEPLILKVSRPSYAHVLIEEARALALFDGKAAPLLLGIATGSAFPQQTFAPDAVVLVTTRAPGESLRALLSSVVLDRQRLAAEVLRQGAEILAQLHAWGRSHGDFKPDNILVHGANHELALIDFGLSSGEAVISGGTPRYLPPEVQDGRRIAPATADAFALAMTVAEILCPEVFGSGAPPSELAVALPEAFRKILGPVLVDAGARPSLRWLVDEVAESEMSSAQFQSVGAIEAIRRAYVATRLSELEATTLDDWILPQGLPGEWVVNLVTRFVAIRQVAGQPRLPGRVRGPMGELSHHDRSRFLGRLVGPTATSWQVPAVSDDEIVSLLGDLSRSQPSRSLSYATFRHALGDLQESQGKEQAPAFQRDSLSRALALGRKPVPSALLREIEQVEGASSPLRIEAGREARLLGHLGLARALLSKSELPSAKVQLSLVLLRSGQRSLGAALLEEALSAGQLTAVDKATARAIRARIELDEGRPHAALSALQSEPRSAAAEEVRALSLLALERPDDALLAVESGVAVAGTDEEAARLWAVRGMILHRQGNAHEARDCFARASERAERLGAVLEEATYLTGLAAAATDMGHLEEALLSSERAELLFESLGRPAQTARALLAHAAILSSLGAQMELSTMVRRGVHLARQTNDSLCEAYFCLCACDGLDDQGERLSFALRAMELLRDAPTDDRLRASARVLSAGGVPDGSADDWAVASTSREARADWYRARAEALDKISSHAISDASREVGRSLASELLQIARAGGRLLSLGPALVIGAHLSLRMGFAEQAKDLFVEARAVADVFLRHVPHQYRAQAEELPWLRQLRGSRVSSESGHAQLSDVEALLHALSQRRGFRALLDQTLDLLLMWTGVQRGLLLLRAPGEKLVVRAARNLDKRDLGRDQHELSYSMARRALDEGRPVVAVDAINDVSAIHRSVHALHLRSVLAVPLSARGEVLGVAYLDDRVRRGAFGEKELSWVSLIGTIAALAILDERDRIQLQRALRRAKRAEEKLSGQLTSREAELEIVERELSRTQGRYKLRGDYSQIIGRSPSMRELLELVDRVSNSDVPALVVGESGTGKELIARAIASSGPRRDGPFVAENCSAVPETLLESALFGHQKGAFTGAMRNQPGLFELAHRGTLFLDEIGDMPLSMQTKLLRVLQEGEIRALGADRVRKVDVRVIVATHKDLKELVADGRFREDLYYRLNVITLRLPPLRERQEDISELVQHFLAKYSPNAPRTISQAAMRRLAGFTWPGNVRQLENEVRRMIVLGGDELTAADLSDEIMSEPGTSADPATLREKVDALERRLVMEALEQARGNRTRAAEALGLSRFGLQKMTQRLGILLSPQQRKAGRTTDRGLDE